MTMSEKQLQREMNFAVEHRAALEWLVKQDIAAFERRVLGAFNNNEDPHTVAASLYYGVHPASITPVQRKDGKALNHLGMLYGDKKEDLVHLLETSYTITGRKRTEPELQNVSPR